VSRTTYYEELKVLARQVRTDYDLNSPRVLRSDLRRIYKDHQIRIDYWPYRLKGLRGAYFDDEMGTSVFLAKLPPEPTIFTMGHELKHHLVDRARKAIYCAKSNENEAIEIGAEIFAAELVFPELDFAAHIKRMGVGLGKCTAEDLVCLKHETKTTLSCTALAKRAEFLGFAQSGSLAKVAWKKLEEQIYGEPVYKRINRRRAMASAK
jgi:Zn-dependent peptidase ImmA (M78 family)